MSDPMGNWTDRLQDLNTETNPDAADEFVHDLYMAAQEDLDEQRAKADFDREE
jgi:hypothetical protein